MWSYIWRIIDDPIAIIGYASAIVGGIWALFSFWIQRKRDRNHIPNMNEMALKMMADSNRILQEQLRSEREETDELRNRLSDMTRAEQRRRRRLESPDENKDYIC